MFVFGHLGFGSTLARPWRNRLSRWALLAGMILPDAIDKPLYYARLSPFFSCTRTFGHTGLLILTILLVGLIWRRRVFTALALGMTTHVLLDCALDAILGGESSALRAAIWPLMGVHFTYAYLSSVAEHAERLLNAPVLVAEVLGAGLLWWEVSVKTKKPWSKTWS